MIKRGGGPNTGPALAILAALASSGVGRHALASAEAGGGYPNATLSSGTVSARVFLPELRKSGAGDAAAGGDGYYYRSSRFEHGSMIGDVVLRGDASSAAAEVYGRGMWRQPHDPSDPESGLGLASEFGCGDDGARCAGRGDITNGVLGYDGADPDGGVFLKIGVGALVRGSCPDCGADGAYRFNSPYEFAREPVWTVLPSPDPEEVTFVSEERLGEDWGYRLQKTTRLDGNVLTVRSMLTNIGRKQFTTPWYCHHFFTGDDTPVGPGYRLDLGLSEYGLEMTGARYRQPGLGTWSGDLADYANVTMAPDGSIGISFRSSVPAGRRLKAEFLDGSSAYTLTDGSFALSAPNGVRVQARIPELQTQSRNPFIYGYNVYVERGTLSPEPMLLLYLQPDETTVWTQHLKFTREERGRRRRGDGGGLFAFLSIMYGSDAAGLSSAAGGGRFAGARLAAAACCLAAALAWTAALRCSADGRSILPLGRRRHQYKVIPDCPVPV